MRTSRARRSAVLAAVLLGVPSVAAVAGCTSAADTPDTPTPAEAEAPPALAVTAPVTRVAGRLGDRDRLALRRQVEELLGRWVTAAYLEPGTPRAGRLPGFTEGAARLVRDRGDLLSGLGRDLDGATVRGAAVEAPVSVLAPRGEPAGATARLDLVLDLGPETAQDVHVTGRLLLTPVGQGWRVFGFDVKEAGR